MLKTLYIKSTIHAVDGDHPEVIEQQFDAEFLQIEDEIQILYQEGEGEQISTVRIFSYENKMIILRNGPIRYQQTYVTGEPTLCKMELPGGQIEVVVKTHSYFRTSESISCQFTLEESNQMKLGDYQLELEWKL
ncbi:DUF1934 domain-containing protein [Shimazuella sp. AN120528]|uniref:DUF1934 domain-containing protein n=1 Tax=Shimazuella soli TaxID=1892854 RepID=UPI001F0EBDA7|nr:DUF1934 domain-containing protein [Shimazuella soli]MCH5585089.1 DUF1934 domain-containing protein [Shimazuella soli]